VRLPLSSSVRDENDSDDDTTHSPLEGGWRPGAKAAGGSEGHGRAGAASRSINMNAGRRPLAMPA